MINPKETIKQLSRSSGLSPEEIAQSIEAYVQRGCSAVQVLADFVASENFITEAADRAYRLGMNLKDSAELIPKIYELAKKVDADPVHDHRLLLNILEADGNDNSHRKY